MLSTRSRLVVAISWVFLCIASRSGASADWPTWQHDNRRSGSTAEEIDAKSLGTAWIWRSPFPPQPAWAGPAKWDAFAKIKNLPSMRNYDLAFQPIAFADSVVFGSSADDTVYCLNAATGKQRWSFTTDGPVRIAPSFHDGELYFGSDDGQAYCISAADGSLIWKFRPVEPQRRFLNNGRLIPFHPCRTGVLIDDGIAWFACGMLPWKKAYLCAVDAKTGRATDERGFVRQLDGKTLEGAPAASSKLLIFPQGRVAPQVFRRSDGQDLGLIKKSGGGSIVVVSLDSQLLHGPATNSRKGGIRGSDPATFESVAGYGRGNALVVAGHMSYMLTDDEIIASDLVQRKVVWKAACDCRRSLIAAGNVLFAGGEDHLVAVNVKDGREVWRHSVEGTVFGMALANGRLIVSTDTGTIHVFRPSEGETAAAAQQTSAGAKTEASGEVAKISPHDHKALIGRWVFQSPAVQGKVVENLSGKPDGTAAGTIQLERIGDRQAMVLDGGKQSVLLAANHADVGLPNKTLSVESWVRVDQPQEWGGIIGATQDNGAYERGWLLGFRKQKFSFAMAGKEANGRLTILTAESDFESGRWYHVAGTYDGQTMRLFVNGRLENKSTEQRGEINYPPTAFYEIGAYHDQNEYYPMTGRIHEVCVYGDVLTEAEVKARFDAHSGDFPRPPETTRLATGPWLQFMSPRETRVRWKTRGPSPSILEYELNGDAKRITDDQPKTDHEVTLTGLKRNRTYQYKVHTLIDGKKEQTQEYECDTFFNYNLAGDQTEQAASTQLNMEPYAESAKTILGQTGIDRGLCLVLGSGEGRLARELAIRSRLSIVGCETDPRAVAESRRMLKQAGLYGGRVVIHQVDDLSKLPFVGSIANLVVSERAMSEGKLPGTAAEMLRMLRPDGGVALLGQPATATKQIPPQELKEWFQATSSQPELIGDQRGTWAMVKRAPLPGAGEWTHAYGLANNSAFGGEQLAGATGSEDLEVHWVGRPGPRYQPDRQGRKPPPLSAAGRLFLQGLRRIVTLDAYNGSVLWSLEIPDLHRFNLPRDCSNWCADREFVFAAIRDKCWRINAKNGEASAMIDVVKPKGSDGPYDWGFVARDGNMLIGSAVRQGTSWTEFWGHAGWYDDRTGDATLKICSDNLFALDRDSAEPKWSRTRGVILNSTITIADDVVYFVECRNQKVLDAPSRRLGLEQLWQDQFLVALNVSDGSPRWEQPIDTVDGSIVFYMASSRGRLVIVSSNDRKYYVYSFAAKDGQLQWEKSVGWPGGKGDHGKAISRPAIVGNEIYVKPRVLSLKDGTPLDITIPAGKCGTYACSQNALFFRTNTVTMWDRHQGRVSRWTRLRPDCWLSTIPAAGMLLSPEGGGGCSCGSWMETSIGFMPLAHE